LQKFQDHQKSTEQVVDKMLKLPGLQWTGSTRGKRTVEQILVDNGGIDPKRHLEMSVDPHGCQHYSVSRNHAWYRRLFRLCLSYSYSNGIIISIIYLLTTCLLYLGPVSIVVAMALQTSLHDYNYNLERACLDYTNIYRYMVSLSTKLRTASTLHDAIADENFQPLYDFV
jgi:hypothetical protein